MLAATERETEKAGLRRQPGTDSLKATGTDPDRGPGLVWSHAASNSPGPSQGPRRENRAYHAQGPPAATARRQAGGAPTTHKGPAPRRTTAGTEAGRTGTETQTKAPARLSAQPLQAEGRRAAQDRAKSAACVWRRKPTDTTKPARPRTEGRTQKPDAPNKQADFESVERDGSMGPPFLWARDLGHGFFLWKKLFFFFFPSSREAGGKKKKSPARSATLNKRTRQLPEKEPGPGVLNVDGHDNFAAVCKNGVAIDSAQPATELKGQGIVKGIYSLNAPRRGREGGICECAVWFLDCA